jgi:hypothetical protein
MSIKLNGATSGSVELDVPDAIGSDIGFTLPGADGSTGQVLSTNGSGGLSFVNALTEFDMWVLTANQFADGIITAVSRVARPLSASQIGTGMSESSGIFTFPRTGKWLVINSFNVDIMPADSVGINTEVSSDSGSTWVIHAQSYDGQNASAGSNRRGNATGISFIDVTDVGTFRVKFMATSLNSGSSIVGATGSIATSFTFIRVGDT